MVYSDQEVVAFLDLYPVQAGHTLVVPRRHVPDLASCPPELAGKLMEVSARLAPAVVQATSAAGFNVWTANGRAAGQEIFHLHLHILPRHENDSFGLRFPKGYPREASRQELDLMAEKIRRSLAL
jgi:histidine triad (HIT) family protein